jgi:hypothetical protein
VALAPDPAARHELRLLEHAEMLQHRGAVEFRKRTAEFTGREARALELVEHAPAHRGGEGTEDEVVVRTLAFVG